MNGQNANSAISIKWTLLSLPVRCRRPTSYGGIATWVVLLGLLCLNTPSLDAADEHAGHRHGASGTSGRSLANNAVTWPTREKFIETITLKQYNTRVVFLGTLLLGVCAAMVGTFMLLRKRALMGDVVGHATLPGIGIAFIVMELIKPDSGKWLPGLLIGAFIAGLCGIAATTLIRRYSRVKEDTAMAIVLSIFFGLGVVLFSIVQNIPSGSVAGLKHFIFGKTGSIAANDVQLIGAVSLVALLMVLCLFKEFALLCFDEAFAATQGYPTLRLDLSLMMLVALVAVIGLQSVGLLLVVALLIIPPAAARFWTDHLWRMTAVAVVFGGVGASAGVLISAMSKAPAGPTIVLVGTLIFTISLFCGPQRGVVSRLITHLRLKAQLDRDHVLQACYEWLEKQKLELSHSFEIEDILPARSWTKKHLRRLVARCRRQGFLQATNEQRFSLTKTGGVESQRVVRNHRLWETFLITHADIATSQVDRHAHTIEDVLDAPLIQELESILNRNRKTTLVEQSSPTS